MNELLRKIDSGYDGLIRSIQIKNFDSAIVIISVQDNEVKEWINVRFTIESLEEFKILQKPKMSNVVMSSGIKIKKISEMFYIDFAPFSFRS